ncbi:MAG: nitrilase-related carbon-nitrogen hydrolase [Gulosibacter sp.]|uniref:nitrilase-related carbon-nitrogen hydrolase n=1 Tax=Gulosibacter sp. TaxID=2817531 RepID=UPI003F92A5FC
MRQQRTDDDSASAVTRGPAPKSPSLAANLPRIIAAVLSGVLLAWSYALEPSVVAAWFAPIPLLIAAMRVRWTHSLALGALAGAIASASLFGYMVGLGGPVDALLITVARAAQWALFAVIARVVAVRLRSAPGVWVLPALMAGFEVLTAAVSPHGSGGSIVYSQLDAIPVIQIASVGGVAAIAFLLGLWANIVAYLAVLGLEHRWRELPSVVAHVLIVLLCLGYGSWRVAAPSPTTEAKGPVVAMIGTSRFEGVPENWQEVWEAYIPAITSVAEEQGAQIAVLPEKIFQVDADEINLVLEEFQGQAAQDNLTLVVGVDERTTAADGSEIAYNRVYSVSPEGEIAVYDKRHMIPGGESHFTTGSGPKVTSAAGASASLLICKDMDFPNTVRDSVAGAAVILVPAWDFFEDAWFHSRIAVLRGVENGVPIARAARDGFLTLSDATGRIILEETAEVEEVRALVGRIPPATPTAYALVGDVFGWAALGFFGVVMLVLLSRNPHRNEHPSRESTGATPVEQPQVARN